MKHISPDINLRTDWIDCAKGVLISLVVVHHAVVFGNREQYMPDWVSQLNSVMAALRMPLFFFISGFFIKKEFKKPFRQFLVNRVYYLLYIYIIWSGIVIVAENAVKVVVGLSAKSIAWQILDIIYKPSTVLWFIYALCIFSVSIYILKYTRDSVKFIIAAALFIAFYDDGRTQNLTFAEQLSRMFVWFVLGHIFSNVANMLADLQLSFLRYTPLLWIIVSYLTFTDSCPAWWTALMSAVSLPAGIIFCAQVNRSALGKQFRFLGKRTLPIYVAHGLVLQLTLFLHPSSQNMALCLVAFSVLLGISVPLAIRNLATLTRIDWLYEPPFLSKLR